MMKRIKNVPSFVLISIVCVVINLAVIVGIILLDKNIPPEIPLYYGMPQGADQLTLKSSLPLPSIIAIFLGIINIILAVILKDVFLKRVVSGITVATTSLAVITIIKIVSTVGSF